MFLFINFFFVEMLQGWYYTKIPNGISSGRNLKTITQWLPVRTVLFCYFVKVSKPGNFPCCNILLSNDLELRNDHTIFNILYQGRIQDFMKEGVSVTVSPCGEAGE